MSISLTLGDRAENHFGMQLIGNLAKEGFTLKDLKKIKNKFNSKNVECEFINLKDYLDDEYKKEAQEGGILIIRNGINFLLNYRHDNDNDNDNSIITYNSNNMLQEQLNLVWDHI